MRDPSPPSDPSPPLEPTIQRLYACLRGLSGRLLGSGGDVSVMQATDFVHECYLRLARHDEVEDLPEHEFLKLAATVLRRLIIDDHRRSQTARRGGGWSRVTLSAHVLSQDGPDLDLLALDEALHRLADVDPRQAQVVELRCFAGLGEKEVAEVLGISRRMVTTEWAMARAWLKRELSRGG